MVALAGYMACEQIARTLLDGATLPDDIAHGAQVELGLAAGGPGSKVPNTDRVWPSTGVWAEHVHTPKTRGELSRGYHVVAGWRGLRHLIRAGDLMVVAYSHADVACHGPHRKRLSQLAVLNGLNTRNMVRTGLFRGAELIYGGDYVRRRSRAPREWDGSV